MDLIEIAGLRRLASVRVGECVPSVCSLVLAWHGVEPKDPSAEGVVMAAPAIPLAVLKSLMGRALTTAILTETAAGMGLSLGELLWGIHDAQFAAGIVGSYAQSVQSAVSVLPEAAELAALRTAATTAATTVPTLVAEEAIEEAAKKTLRERLVAALASRLGITVVAAGRLVTGLTIAGIIWLLISLGVWIYIHTGGRGESSSSTAACPALPKVRKLCSFAAPGSAILGECDAGKCFDGGYGHSLACKQENQRVPNAHPTDLNDLVCNDGYTKQVRDRCTGLLLRCDR